MMINRHTYLLEYIKSIGVDCSSCEWVDDSVLCWVSSGRLRFVDIDLENYMLFLVYNYGES